MANNEEKVLKAMKKADKPLKTAEISNMTGIDSKSIGKIIKKLKEEGKVISPKRCFYSIKEK